MKRYFSIIGYFMTPYLVSYVFWYIVGAGLSASWNTANWDFALKNLLTFWAAFFGFALYYRIEQEYK